MKKVIFYIAHPLVFIFNLSLSTGLVPDKLKIAKIATVFKKDDPHKFDNYRPISILPSISKLLEKCIYNRLYSFCLNNKILTDSQYGFRKNHSTAHALIELQDKILTAIHTNKFCIGIFMDLSKAFDVVDHKILLSKLEHYGVRGLPLSWFKSYLSNRSQYVVYNNSSSDFCSITHGVPQGSILGPLLFLIYINDLIHSSNKFDYIMYADDTTLIYSQPYNHNLQNDINAELDKVTKRFKSNRLLIP